MSGIAIAGAGAFGTALAIALAREKPGVCLWARDPAQVKALRDQRENSRHLPGILFPQALEITGDSATLTTANIVLLVVPTQHLRQFLTDHKTKLAQQNCVVCCKGIEKSTGLLPSQIVEGILPDAKISVLTGPGFAAEIARGRPTALTLASRDASLQQALSGGALRLYLSGDLIGAQLGGALKNVIAIACGISIGAGLGESARASLMTRGYAELKRLAIDMGAEPKTLSGLSGFGDLTLTCTSEQSRNYRLGFSLGAGEPQATGTTVEGVATALALVELAKNRKVDMPIAAMVASILQGGVTISEALHLLLSRPLKPE